MTSTKEFKTIEDIEQKKRYMHIQWILFFSETQFVSNCEFLV